MKTRKYIINHITIPQKKKKIVPLCNFSGVPYSVCNTFYVSFSWVGQRLRIVVLEFYTSPIFCLCETTSDLAPYVLQILLSFHWALSENNRTNGNSTVCKRVVEALSCEMLVNLTQAVFWPYDRFVIWTSTIFEVRSQAPISAEISCTNFLLICANCAPRL
jgi:hypothetical protein